ncbi:hypothetical protein L1987_10874 [Smallanthus sonchifolius]|uniref:Uncharacterized protein n=1 Tax=Smallanthus sonchifolius TaxID=185202 RepID=A0ACB9J9Q6_9ASTR|nr:hypothetical protein L1987_10874 [Smallanthus sonchifolius]
MEGATATATDQQAMILLFLEIAVGQTADTAKQFLQATDWTLDEAIQLFYVGNEFGEVISSPYIPPTDFDLSSPYIPPPDFEVLARNQNMGPSSLGGSPHAAHTSFDAQSSFWEADQGSTLAAGTSRENLASLYRPPVALMYPGSFEQAKEAANCQDKWLLVNVQSTKEVSSHLLNLDTWSNETVAQTITSSFIFWQICDDTEEGSKIVANLELDSVPVTLVVDPITGLKMRLWRGMIQPESLLEDMLDFMNSSPTDHHVSSSHKHPRESSQALPPKIQDETNEDDDQMKVAQALSMITMKSEGFLKDSGAIKDVPKKEKHNYPALPEEPKGDKSLLCRVGFRLPDGSRVQRNFLRSDPIQLLWSFCAAKCGDEKPFRLTHAIPGAVKDVEFDSMLTFDDSSVANSMILVTWE